MRASQQGRERATAPCRSRTPSYVVPSPTLPRRAIAREFPSCAGMSLLVADPAVPRAAKWVPRRCRCQPCRAGGRDRATAPDGDARRARPRLWTVRRRRTRDPRPLQHRAAPSQAPGAHLRGRKARTWRVRATSTLTNGRLTPTREKGFTIVLPRHVHTGQGQSKPVQMCRRVNAVS
jgi:hypothetical protein